MEVLDTTIANVALRYIAGGLSASNVDSEWVLTSYLAANAIILPITGWLSAHLGRRNYFLLSIAVFTIASGLCGMATSLEQLILFRVIQGLGGGGLQPSSQAILLDSFPPEKQGAAQTMFGVAALLAPVVGPTLGGYLTVNYNWRWIFYINVPVGALGSWRSTAPGRRPGLPQARAGRAAPPPAELRLHRPGAARPDHVELGSDAQQGAGVGLVQRPVLAGADAGSILFVVGLGCLIFRELRIANPMVNFRPLSRAELRRPAASSSSVPTRMLYGASTSLPGLLQSLFGYDAYVSGLVQSPSGVFSDHAG